MANAFRIWRENYGLGCSLEWRGIYFGERENFVYVFNFVKTKNLVTYLKIYAGAKKSFV